MPAALTTPPSLSQLSTLLLIRRARRAFRGAVAALAVATVAAGAAGCSAAPPPSAEAATERQDLAGVVGAALDEVDLEAKQRTSVRGVVDDLRAGTEPVRVARQRISAKMADRIAAGALSQADVDAALAELAVAEAAAAPVLQRAADRLHGLLDEGQRAELLEAIRSSFDEARHGEGGWRGRLTQLAEDLELTDAQRDAIRAKVREEVPRAMAAGREKRAAMRERVEAVADAFVSDQFDAKALGLGEEGLAARRSFFGTQLRIVQRVLPTLTPAQRTKLADLIRAHTK